MLYSTYSAHVGLALLSIIAICFEYYVISICVGASRAKTYSAKYMAQFNEKHAEEFGTGKLAPKTGLPDMGNGFFSNALSYKEWFLFNNAQRAHYNYLENFTPTIVWIIISLFYHPLSAAVLGFVVFIGRIIYSVGYFKTPNLRSVGAIVFDLGFIGLFVLSLVTIAKWGKVLESEN
ncbi:hypothetical protein FGO68_gene17327 [Halteria grandinella]|uniref:MAPEG family protein n=1 Tax=Halteria grandinella TaxID=5974 RepID=A0A8J8P3W7_HALGN|nr:hypothetical protein FGO68_gene17327 [Halteria grandinella]